MSWKLLIDDKIFEYPSESNDPLDIPQMDYYVTELPVAGNGHLYAIKHGYTGPWTVVDPNGNSSTWDIDSFETTLAMEILAG